MRVEGLSFEPFADGRVLVRVYADCTENADFLRSVLISAEKWAEIVSEVVSEPVLAPENVEIVSEEGNLSDSEPPEVPEETEDSSETDGDGTEEVSEKPRKPRRKAKK